jgi:hypothetical protein
MSTESTQMAPTFTKILSFCVDLIDVGSHVALTQLTGNETLSTESPLNVKYLNKSTNSRTKSKMFKALFGLYTFDKCKKQNKKISCKCTFNTSPYHAGTYNNSIRFSNSFCVKQR